MLSQETSGSTKPTSQTATCPICRAPTTFHDRKELLLRLAAAGRAAIEREANERISAIKQTAGALTGVYRADELERLREDWPA
ncbi:MAG: hypothetical protein WD399_07525 [Thermoleophilaceae bacterium]